MTITLYDFPAKRDEHTAWNPNVWKTRYSLVYKNLPYRTVLVEFPDLEHIMQLLGAAPTETKPDDPQTSTQRFAITLSLPAPSSYLHFVALGSTLLCKQSSTSIRSNPIQSPPNCFTAC
ncbi:AChain Crystal Structure Of Glutathione Transferase Gstfua3 From Phanerochaete Chrysosporium [Lentinula edodes]|uniref:AChain Crystal Structure Of Glutathione Transferase Gstfua3 From Phanerochaete Chrysosporium n=1 Tax=Lentinula edodes TaxID=5353 RepID=A0A1Q3ED19_LENED|nr:AChain Crystal Structure Of Glutathione Transferase Gstfua3 From Phanerochaete Chrysosporium [Lentinula edodes]